MFRKRIFYIVTIIIGAALVTGIAECIYILKNNVGEYYTLDEKRNIYHDGIPLNANDTTMTYIDRDFVKDSASVYLRGKPILWIDASTFESIDIGIYKDRRGIYKKSSSWFSQSLKQYGDYDANSFETIGFLFKDKNNIYQFNQFFHPKLYKVNKKGIDVPSLKALSYHWYADKYKVYYTQANDFYTLRVAPDIDRNSLELIDEVVVKDKNHYYVYDWNMKKGSFYTTCDSIIWED